MWGEPEEEAEYQFMLDQQTADEWEHYLQAAGEHEMQMAIESMWEAIEHEQDDDDVFWWRI